MRTQLLLLDACSLVDAFRQGDTTPPDYLSTCLERIYRADAKLGAFNAVNDQRSLLREAEESADRYRRGEPRSPLDGVPFAVKANIAIRMMPWHGGVAALAKRMASVDSAAVATMRRAGMIPIGITNMHEAALGVTTDNWAFGRTLNPHNLAHIPGGSSGGSAAAVSAGMVPIALGTDNMGSVRLPSALCGVIGYKPEFGCIPVDGLIPLSPQLDHIGIHARSIADVKALMRLFNVQNDTSHRLPPFKYWQLGSELEFEQRVVLAQDRVLSSLGCNAPLDWRRVDLSALRRAGLLICERDAETTYKAALGHSPHGFSEEFRALIDWAKHQPAEKTARAVAFLKDVGERLRRDLKSALLLSPTTPVSAPRVGHLVRNDLPNLTAPANFAGIPSISIPVPDLGPGMPLGLQISGLHGSHVLCAAQRLCSGMIEPILD